MKHLFLFFILCSINLFVFSQNLGLQWTGTFNEDGFPDFNKVSTLDNNGNFIVVGNFVGTVDFDISPTSTVNLTATGSTADIFIAKYSNTGALIWVKGMGDNSPDYESGYSVTVDNNDNIIVAGFFSGTVDFDPSGGVYNLSSTLDASFLLKLNSAGNFVWAQKITEQDEQGYDLGLHVATDNSNNIYMVGDFVGTNDFDNGPGTTVLSTSGGLANDSYILKKDQNGTFLWVKQFQSQSADYYNRVRSIDVNNSGDIYLTGYFAGDVDFDPSTTTQIFSTSSTIDDAFLVKLNTSGGLSWMKKYGTTNGKEKGMSVHLDNNNDLLFAVDFNDNIDISYNSSLIFTTNGASDFCLAKINPAGNFIWGKRFGGVLDDGANAVTVSTGNDIYLTGTFNSSLDFDPNTGVHNLTTVNLAPFILKLDNNANFQFVKAFSINTNNYLELSSINLDAQGSIFVCSGIDGTIDMDLTNAISLVTSPNITNGNSDCVIAKYCQFVGEAPQISLTQALTCVSNGGLTSNYSSNNLWSTNSTSQSISVNAAGDYTLTVTDANGCKMNDMVTIELPTPPQISAGLDQTLCSGGSTSITATGASTYLWDNGLGAGATHTVSPTVSTTYTVTSTTVNGCVSSDQVLVAVQNCGTCYNPSTSTQIGHNGLLTGTFSNASTTYTINNDVVLTGNTTFTNTSLTFASNVKLTVPAGVTLTIQGAHLYACDQMWKGIEIQAGGKVNMSPYIVSGIIQRTCLIEDALTALNFLVISSQQSSPILVADNVTFNRNHTAVSVQGYGFSNVNSMFVVENSLFTSRTIFDTSTPNIWPLTNTVKASNGTTNPYSNPYISLSSYSLANLKAPNTTIRAQYGVKLKGVGSTVGTTTPVFNEIIIGSTVPKEYNLFDNIEYGIDVLNTNITAQNCKFQDPKKISAFSTPNGFATGINAVCSNQKKYKVNVNAENAFYNMNRGVRIDYYYEVVVTGNTFRSARTITHSAAATNFTIPGRYGIYIRADIYNKIAITTNTLYNIEKAIYFGADNVPVSATPLVIVDNNFIEANYPGWPVSTNSIFDAIQVVNVNSLPYSANVNVLSNTLTGVYRGILAQTWNRALLTVSTNNITLIDQANDPEQYAIAFKGISGGGVKNTISLNYITGFTGSASYTLTSGIKIESSYTNHLECNNVYNTYNGLLFTGNTYNTTTKRNTMNNNKYGFVLDGSSVTLGNQGSATAPCDNVWSGSGWDPTNTLNGEFKTLVANGADAHFSKMYIRSTNLNLPSSFNPNGSAHNISPSLPSMVYSLGNSTLLTSSGFVTSCNSAYIPEDTTLVYEELVERMESSLNTMDSVVSLEEEVEKQKTDMFRSLDANPALRDESLSLQAFYDSTAVSNKGVLLEAEKASLEGDLNLVESKLNLVSPTDLVEQNYKLFYTLGLSYRDSTFNATDSLDLYMLATACPDRDGNVVYQARALYNSIYLTAEVFESVCLDNTAKSMTESTIHGNNWTLINIYPNPNNGEFTVQVEDDSINSLQVNLKDISGKLLFSSRIELIDHLFKMNYPAKSGIYFIEIINPLSGKIYTEKIIIKN